MPVSSFPVLVFSLGLAVLGGSVARGADDSRPSPPAGESLTLPAAITEALARSPVLDQIEADTDAARGQVLTARQQPNPELTFAPGIRRLHEGSSSRREFLGSIELSRTFFFPGKRELLVSLAERNVELRKLAVAGFRFQLTAAVRRAFTELLAAESIVGLRRRQLDSAQDFLAATTMRVEAGYASDFEMIKSRGDVINARKLLAAAEGDIASARVELNTLLGREPAAPLAIQGALDPSAGLTWPDDLVAKALAENPGLHVLATQAEVAALNIRQARLARKPDLTVGPSLEYSPSEQIVGVRVTLPLLNKDYGRGEVLSATAEQRKARAEIERLRREITGAVTQAATRLETARRQLALYTPDYLDQLKSVVAQAEHGYAQNATSLLIYLEAKRTYFDTLADYYDTIAGVARSRADLEAAVGAPLVPLPPSSTP